jgi:hypothetical protein
MSQDTATLRPVPDSRNGPEPRAASHSFTFSEIQRRQRKDRRRLSLFGHGRIALWSALFGLFWKAALGASFEAGVVASLGAALLLSVADVCAFRRWFEAEAIPKRRRGSALLFEGSKPLPDGASPPGRAERNALQAAESARSEPWRDIA